MEIKKLRIKLKLTQADLAKLCGVSLNTMRNWESEVTTPNEENMIKLKEVLKVVE